MAWDINKQSGTEAEARAAWYRYWETHSLPDNVPYNPDVEYADKGWVSWRDFLGWNVEDA